MTMMLGVYVLGVYVLGYILTVVVSFGIMWYMKELDESGARESWTYSFFWPILLPMLLCGVIAFSCEWVGKYIYENFLEGLNARLVNWLNNLRG